MMKKHTKGHALKAKLLNYEARDEVYHVPCFYENYQKIKEFPDLKHFTEDKKYPVINELVTDEIPGPKNPQYRWGGLTYLTRNDEGDMVVVPHVYFNREPMLCGSYLEDDYNKNAWILSHCCMPDLSKIRTLLYWYEKQIEDLKAAKLVAENIKTAFLEKLEVVQKDIAGILDEVKENKESVLNGVVDQKGINEMKGFLEKLSTATEKINEVIEEEMKNKEVK